MLIQIKKGYVFKTKTDAEAWLVLFPSSIFWV